MCCGHRAAAPGNHTSVFAGMIMNRTATTTRNSNASFVTVGLTAATTAISGCALMLRERSCLIQLQRQPCNSERSSTLCFLSSRSTPMKAQSCTRFMLPSSLTAMPSMASVSGTCSSKPLSYDMRLRYQPSTSMNRPCPTGCCAQTG